MYIKLYIYYFIIEIRRTEEWSPHLLLLIPGLTRGDERNL